MEEGAAGSYGVSSVAIDPQLEVGFGVQRAGASVNFKNNLFVGVSVFVIWIISQKFLFFHFFSPPQPFLSIHLLDVQMSLANCVK